MMNNAEGFALWLSREDWGAVYDGLILERAKSLNRKAANPESTSDLRSMRCAAIMRAIGAAGDSDD